ncbi:MAG: PilZ domain-containing protein [Candidatus Eremiobacteraeota bacterium]|nr:PilZ domain-containing protein [Candidatus Eremiobacteraeota bacterium]
MTNPNERRDAIRVKVDVPARYRAGTSAEKPGRIDNISRGGMLLVADEAIPEGTHLRIAFDDQQGRRHEIVGEVVRSAPMGRTGVSFVHIEDATLDYVRVVLGVP